MKPGDVKRGWDRVRRKQVEQGEKQLLLEAELRRADTLLARVRELEQHAKAERPRLVAALREACVEFGDVGWPDDDDLAEVIHQRLLGPLRRERALRTAQLERAHEQIRRLLMDTQRAPTGPRAMPPPARPQAARPPESLLPEPIERNGITVAVIALPGSGYVAGCLCGWRGATRTSVNTAEGDAQAHILRAHGQGSSRYA